MYNKIFSKILDSSVWLESEQTRLVWLTLIAAMDEDGFVQFASVLNLAHRARVSAEAAKQAVAILEAPDPDSSDPDHEGRRIERVHGGWIVLNSKKYREIVSRAVARASTKERVRRFRENRRKKTRTVTDPLRDANAPVTPSEAEARSEKIKIKSTPSASALPRLRAEPAPKVLARLAHDILDAAPPDTDESELSARLKDAAAKLGLVYNGAAAGTALNVARAQKGHRPQKAPPPYRPR